jgi:arabinofuranosyltransferase
LNKVQLAAIGAAVLLLGATAIHATLLSNSSYARTEIASSGIADERGYYYQNFGLLSQHRLGFAAPDWKPGKRSVRVICGGLGFAGVFGGPGIHFIDDCGLADPLLARLPAKRNPRWRIGHFTRQLPTDYEESIESGKNMLKDGPTRAYYESLRTITRAPLGAPDRLREIWRFNTGTIAKPDWAMYQSRPVAISSRSELVQLASVKAVVSGAAPDAPGNVKFRSVVELWMEQPAAVSELDFSIDNKDTYRIEARWNGGWMPLATVHPAEANGMARHHIKLSETMPATDRIRISASSAEGMHSLGHFLVK